MRKSLGRGRGYAVMCGSSRTSRTTSTILIFFTAQKYLYITTCKTSFPSPVPKSRRGASPECPLLSRHRREGGQRFTSGLEQNRPGRLARKVSPGVYFQSWLHKIPGNTGLCSENARQPTRKLQPLPRPPLQSESPLQRMWHAAEFVC